MPNTLLQDLQEINAAFRCGTCPGGPEEECDDQCEKHRLEYMAEELVKKGWRIGIDFATGRSAVGWTMKPPAPLHRSDEPTPPAEQRCGDCALWGTDMQDEERVDGIKHCPKWHCWTSKGLGPILGCFVEKEG